MELTNGPSAEKNDNEAFDFFPDGLDFDTFNFENFATPFSPTEGKRQHMTELPGSKRLRTEDVSDLLHASIGDSDFMCEDTFSANDNIEFDGYFPEKENICLPPEAEMDIDEFLSVLDHDDNAELPCETDNRIPLPSKRWLGYSVVKSSPKKKKKVVKEVRHVISVKRVYVEERTLSTAQKARHKKWATKRIRCLTGFRGYKCPAKSKAAKNKFRNNGRFE